MKKDFGLIFYLHLIFILLAYISPFLFNYWLILLGIVLLELQYLILGGCVLTHMEMGKERHMTFYYYYLSKIFPSLMPKTVWVWSTIVLPILIFSLAIYIQVYLNIPSAIY